jgi:signal transduction histidine kinase
LAISHAVLALVLVAIAGAALVLQSQRLRTEDTRAGAINDAKVLAARVGGRGANQASLAALVSDEGAGERVAEVVDDKGTRLAGGVSASNKDVLAHVRAAIDSGRVSTVRTPSGVVAVVPASVGQNGRGAVLIQEKNPGRGFDLMPLGIALGLAALMVAAAAAAGWFLAGRISRPIEELTDAAHRLALGRDAALPTTPASVPEVDTLTAALARVEGRVQRLKAEEELRASRARGALRRVSHQMRTPLTVMRLRLDDVCDPGLPEERRVLLADVFERQIDSLDDLAERLKGATVSDINTPLTRVDLSGAVARVVRRLVPLARWSGLDLREGGDAGVFVAADAALLDDAVANVIENAIKFTSRGGHIRIVVSVRDGEAWVSVADTGPGIAPEERELVVRPSVRGSAGAGAVGSGLGLSLVADALDRMGGRLELDNGPGGGAVVRLVLRLADRLEAPVAEPEPTKTA